MYLMGRDEKRQNRKFCYNKSIPTLYQHSRLCADFPHPMNWCNVIIFFIKNYRLYSILKYNFPLGIPQIFSLMLVTLHLIEPLYIELPITQVPKRFKINFRSCLYVVYSTTKKNYIINFCCGCYLLFMLFNIITQRGSYPPFC